MNREPLDESRIRSELEKLPGWSFDNNRITKEFVFKDFREAMSFLVRLAFFAEEQDHHPELHNVYNRVVVTLSTHDAANRVTQADIRLASAIERFVWV